MADRSQAKAKAKAYTKSKKKGAMDGMTVKGGHKLSTAKGAGLTAKGRASINKQTKHTPVSYTHLTLPTTPYV